MASFKKHKEASVEFQKEIAQSGLDALKVLGKQLKDVGKKLAEDQDKEEPSHVLADAALGLGKAHETFREGALEAAAKALAKVRKHKSGPSGS